MILVRRLRRRRRRRGAVAECAACATRVRARDQRRLPPRAAGSHRTWRRSPTDPGARSRRGAEPRRPVVVPAVLLGPLRGAGRGVVQGRELRLHRGNGDRRRSMAGCYRQFSLLPPCLSCFSSLPVRPCADGGLGFCTPSDPSRRMYFTLGASSHESHVLLRRNLIVLLCILAPEYGVSLVCVT